MKNKRLIIILASAATLLLVPLIAMQFTNEVNWTLMDFVVAGALLVGTGLLVEITWRNIKVRKYRMIIYLGLALMLLLIWAELGVGIFGTPFAGN